MLHTDDFDRGLKNRRAVLGDAWVDKSTTGATDFNADFQSLITRYAWHDIWGRPGLDHTTRRDAGGSRSAGQSVDQALRRPRGHCGTCRLSGLRRCTLDIGADGPHRRGFAERFVRRSTLDRMVFRSDSIPHGSILLARPAH